MVDVLITAKDFDRALQTISALSVKEREVLRKDLNARGASGYYVKTKDDEVSMKLVTRLAYRNIGQPWTKGDGLQSAFVYRLFKDDFEIEHRPKPRPLSGKELNKQDLAEREYISRLKRKGQASFRRKLLAIDSRCVISGFCAINALEAAHIRPASERGSFAVENGILLRADLHRLFDLGYLAVNPKTGRLWLHKSCKEDYNDLIKEAKKLHSEKVQGGREAFADRWRNRAT